MQETEVVFLPEFKLFTEQADHKEQNVCNLGRNDKGPPKKASVYKRTSIKKGEEKGPPSPLRFSRRYSPLLSFVLTGS